QTQARWWLGSAVFAVLVTVVSLWLGVGWFVNSLWEQIALTASVFVLSTIGGMVLVAALTEHLREDQLRRVFASVGAVTVLCALTASAMLGMGWMTATTFVEVQQNQPNQQSQ